MMTFAQTWPVVLGDGGLSSNVAVAAAALVVVLTIVLVFVMVLRSNSAGRKASSGLGYDAQVGPIGQPRNDADSAWQRQGGPASGGYDYGTAGQMSGARGSGAGWGQDYADPRGMAGANTQAQWGGQQAAAAGWGQDYAAGGQQGQGAWGANPATGGQQGAWGNQSSGQGAWGMSPASGAGQPAWDAPAGAQQGTPAPWDQGGAQSWGGQQAAAQPAGSWGMGGAQQPAMGQEWGAQQQGAWGAAGGAAYADMERTRSARPDAPQRSYVLVVQEGKEQGRPYELRKDRITIGRSRESDIFLEDLAVSRLHTSINREMDGRYLLRDEGSANGTYVNGQRVNEKMLEEGDEVQVGQTVLKFTHR